MKKLSRSFATIFGAAGLSVCLGALLLTLPTTPPAGDAYAQAPSKKLTKAQKTKIVEPWPINDNVDDPAVWGKVFPLQYELYLKTVDMERTK